MTSGVSFFGLYSTSVLRQNPPVRTVAAYTFIALYTLVLGPPVLLLAALTGSQRLIIEAGLSGTRVALRLAGIGWHLAGAAHIPDGRGAVFCVNHASYLDLVAFVALYPVCPGLRVIYKSEFGRVPILGRVFSMAGAIPVQRAQHERAVEALDHGVDALRAGLSMLAAPEGTRSRDGALAPFKKGLFVMAIQAGAPVLPVAIHGARTALPRGAWRITPGTITVTLGEPVETTGLGYDDRARLADTVRERLAALLATPN